MRGAELERELLRILGFEWRGRNSASLVEEVGQPKTTVRDALFRLYRRGQVERADNGLWYLACTDKVEATPAIGLAGGALVPFDFA